MRGERRRDDTFRQQISEDIITAAQRNGRVPGELT